MIDLLVNLRDNQQGKVFYKKFEIKMINYRNEIIYEKDDQCQEYDTVAINQQQ